MKTILAVSVFALLSLPVMSVAASVYEMPAVLVTAERTFCGDRYIGRHKAFRSV